MAVTAGKAVFLSAALLFFQRCRSSDLNGFLERVCRTTNLLPLQPHHHHPRRRQLCAFGQATEALLAILYALLNACGLHGRTHRITGLNGRIVHFAVNFVHQSSLHVASCNECVVEQG